MPFCPQWCSATDGRTRLHEPWMARWMPFTSLWSNPRQAYLDFSYVCTSEQHWLVIVQFTSKKFVSNHLTLESYKLKKPASRNNLMNRWFQKTSCYPWYHFSLPSLCRESLIDATFVVTFYRYNRRSCQSLTKFNDICKCSAFRSALPLQSHLPSLFARFLSANVCGCISFKNFSVKF